ncbi:MAG: hypothetical protein V4812_00140 [Pseudomonadota bacterium]
MEAVRREIKAFSELMLIAMLVLLLPWPWAFRGLRFVTRFSWMRGVYDQEASRAAAAFGLSAQFEQARLISLHRLVDMADYFLTLKYGQGWMRRYLRVTGDVLPDYRTIQAPLFVTFHYGQGFWALRYFREQGFPLAWLHLPPPTRALLGEKVASWMGRRRIARVSRLCGARAIAVGGSIERMRERLLKAQQPVMAMPDAPLQPGQSRIAVRLLERAAYLPAGTIRMAVQAQVPVIIYSILVDPVSGVRRMHIEGPVIGQTQEALAQTLANHLQAALLADPSAWHMWPWAQSFFVPEAEVVD